MALGERFSGTGSSEVARFLAGHQACDAGFDVTRGKGAAGGRLQITCKGCGESVEYRASQASEAPEIALPGLGNGHAKRVDPDRLEQADPSTLLTAASPKPSPSPRARSTPPPRRPGRVSAPSGAAGLPSWLPAVVIGVVIVGGIALIVAGLLRSGSDSGGESASTATEGEQSVPAQPAQTAPAQEAPATPAAPSPAEPGLKRETFANLFAIGVPRGWSREATDGGAVLTSPGGAARIQVFSQSASGAPSELAARTVDYLAQQHPGATVSKPRKVRFGGGSAFTVSAEYGGGEETAAVLSASGVDFLVTCRVDADASVRVADQARAACASFRPR